MNVERDDEDEGWLQVRAGVSLIVWSRLARFDVDELEFEPADVRDFESHHCHVHPEFGRLICWIGFSVGAEYLAKGVCLLKGQLLTKRIWVIEPPPEGDKELEQWIDRVSKGRSVKREGKKLPTLAKVPTDTIEALGQNRSLVSAAIKYLASAIRNRDAHRYERDVRAAHFQAVPRLFVPALNALLRCVDQPELRHRLKGIQSP